MQNSRVGTCKGLAVFFKVSLTTTEFSYTVPLWPYFHISLRLAYFCNGKTMHIPRGGIAEVGGQSYCLLNVRLEGMTCASASVRCRDSTVLFHCNNLFANSTLRVERSISHVWVIFQLRHFSYSHAEVENFHTFFFNYKVCKCPLK